MLDFSIDDEDEEGEVWYTEKKPPKSFKPIKEIPFHPFGSRLRGKQRWEGNEDAGDWEHTASALSLGEGNVLKYGTTYPLRTGLGSVGDMDGDGNKVRVSYFEVDKKKRGLEVGVVEEVYVTKGTCLVSLGTVGSESYEIKALYRPLDSYGTGADVIDVVKTKFHKDIKSDECEETDTYYCLLERTGISLYAEGKSESHVSYMAEFQIEKIISCPFGLIVVPVYQPQKEEETSDSSSDSKFLYALTHPSKQVSRVWIKGAGNDFMEFDATNEMILGCDQNLCVFWDAAHHSGFSIKRLIRLKKEDIMDSTALNASIYYTSTEQCSTSSPFTPAGGSSMYSPIGRPQQRSSTIRLSRDHHYKESHSATYWPSFSFDYSNNSAYGYGLSTGFYPPHHCVYDDAEIYFKPLFSCYNSMPKNTAPGKFQTTSKRDKDTEILTVWVLIENTLFMHCVNIRLGKELARHAINNVSDFICSEEQYDTFQLAILTSTNELKLMFLDSWSRVCFISNVTLSTRISISKLDAFLYNDALFCEMETTPDRVVLKFQDSKYPSVISTCLEKLKTKLPPRMVTQVLSLFLANSTDDSSRPFARFARFLNDINSMIEYCSKRHPTLKTYLNVAITSAMGELAVRLIPTPHYIRMLSDVTDLSLSPRSTSRTQEMKSSPRAVVYRTFLDLLPLENPSGHRFDSLPYVLQVLLKDPDSMESLVELSDLLDDGHEFTMLIEVLVEDVFGRNADRAGFHFPPALLLKMDRKDYITLPNPAVGSSKSNPSFEDRKNCSREKINWRTPVFLQNIFIHDRRLEEVARLLDSSSSIKINCEQKPGVSDHDFMEEQERHALQLMQVSLSAPVGRGAFTLRTEAKAFANLTNVIHIPRLCLIARCGKKGATMDLNDTNPDYTSSQWPFFHNAVASTLAVRFSDKPADAWFSYNKNKTADGVEQAGMILGFGLNGVLRSMPATIQHEYLAKENSFISMAMLLGLAANDAGTADMMTWKIISLHIGALLPACTTELEVPKLASLVAPLALGVLFIGTHNSHIAKVLLEEIAKRYTPLSLFGGGTLNNSAGGTTGDTSGSIADRETHALCSGLGLGFVNLGKGRIESVNMEDAGFDGILRRFVVGGPKPNTGSVDDEDASQPRPDMPSLWEEYRCCHIEEGENVNVDVTTPAAIIAVALTYLKSGNDPVLRWLSPPDTLELLDGVRPDILMLMALGYILVLKEIPDEISWDWMEKELMPNILGHDKNPVHEYKRVATNTGNVSWAAISTGYCLGLGIRLAGTRHESTVETIDHYIDFMLKLGFLDSTLNADFPKNFIESIVCSMALAKSLLLSGSGDIPTLRLLRLLQHKLSVMPVSPSTNSYGIEMCVSLATGILFLGGGRYSLCNDDRSIALILASVFPKWPINANDNRYHLQALRHLYVLACQPRLLLVKPLTPFPLWFEIEYTNGHRVLLEEPALLPPFDLMKRISLYGDHVFDFEFVLPKDLPYLKKVMENNGIIHLALIPSQKQKGNFLEEMGWRSNTTLTKFKRQYMKSRWGEGIQRESELTRLLRTNAGSGLRERLSLKQVLSDFVREESKSLDWQLQVQILCTWVARSQSQFRPSMISLDLLGMLVTMTDAKFCQILPTVPKCPKPQMERSSP